MQGVKMIVISEKEKNEGKSVVDKPTQGYLDLKTVGFVEKGTSNGKMAIFLIVENKHGLQYSIAMTEGIFQNLTLAYEGVVQRFKDERKNEKEG